MKVDEKRVATHPSGIRRLHLDAEKIAKANLSDVVTDVFVVHEACILDVRRSWRGRNVGL
jgi:hypothetical protein